MRTGKPVDADGRKSSKPQKLAAQLLGDIHQKVRELIDRIEVGSVDPWWAINELQCVIEGQRRAPSKKWEERNGIFYFTVTSDGATGPDWVDRLKSRKRNIELDMQLEFVLNSNDFQCTSGKMTRVAIVPARMFSIFSTSEPTQNQAAQHLKNLKRRERHGVVSFKDMSVETVCLVREYLSDEDIGNSMNVLWIHATSVLKMDEENNPGNLLINAQEQGHDDLPSCGLSINDYTESGTKSIIQDALSSECALMFEVVTE